MLCGVGEKEEECWDARRAEDEGLRNLRTAVVLLSYPVQLSCGTVVLAQYQQRISPFAGVIEVPPTRLEQKRRRGRRHLEGGSQPG